MVKFTDTTGCEWKVKIDIGRVKRIQEDLGINLLGDVAALIRRLADNPIDLFELLRIICEEQAAKIGVDPGQFLERLSGDSIDAAVEAFWEALRLFIPRPSVREALGRLIEKQREVVGHLDRKIAKAVQAELEAVNPETIADGLMTTAPSAGSPGTSGATERCSTG